MKTAIITGVTGQDGSHLSDLLLSKDYKVIGIVRRNSQCSLGNVEHLRNLPNFIVEYGNITDSIFINNLIKKYKPDEYYNLAANSFVANSFDNPLEVSEVNYKAVLTILDAIKRLSPKTKFYQASTSEMFGKNEEAPQNEKTNMSPVSPYGHSKLAAYQAVQLYRKQGLFACNGILFNHEGERRGIEFVTRKITNEVARIKAGLSKELRLGNLKAKRDWGYSPEFTLSMYLMLQQKVPDDYVIATGETHTIEEFVKYAFEEVKIKNWKKYVKIDPKFYRPAEVNILCGDYSKAKKILKWKPKVTFKELVKKMVQHDLELYL